jgi:UDP-glucose 4-epimerase
MQPKVSRKLAQLTNRRDRLLIVGFGFIGSAIAASAIRTGFEVRVITRSAPPARQLHLDEIDLRVADASDADCVALALDGVDHVVYAAGDLHGGISAQNPAESMQRELSPLLTVLGACGRTLKPSFTFLSSGGTVYGLASRLPIAEDHPTDPLSSYGVTKLACEKFVLMAARLQGLRVRILRCSNVYGEGQSVDRPQGLVAVAFDHLVRGEPVTVFGDGSSVRDYIYVDDVAAAVLALFEAPVDTGPINLGTGNGTSIRELLQAIELAADRRMQIRWERSRGFDVPANVLDTSRLHALVKLSITQLQDGLRRTWLGTTGEGLDAPALRG